MMDTRVFWYLLAASMCLWLVYAGDLSEQTVGGGASSDCLDLGLYGITCEELEEQYLIEHGKSLCIINKPLASRCCELCAKFWATKDEL